MTLVKHGSQLGPMQSAKLAAGLSLDPSTQVGAVVVADGAVVARACNMLSRGVPQSTWKDRPLKYKAVVHAELAALLEAGRCANGGTLYSTAHPCRDCAKAIIAAKVKTVVCPPGPWRDDPAVIETVMDAKWLFANAGIDVQYIGEEDA